MDLSKLRVFEELNPWWQASEVPRDLSGVRRDEYLNKLKALVGNEEISLVSGIRRSGKTTLLYQTIDYLLGEGIDARNILLVNCDEIVVKNSFKDIHEIISTFNSSGEGRKYVFLDEVQYFEDWEQELKNAFDRFRKNVKIIASGSSAMLAKSKKLYFLTGRFEPLIVYPFSFKEFLQANEVKFFEEKSLEEKYEKNVALDLDKYVQQYLLYGGFPRIVFEKNVGEKKKLGKLYFETILYKDIVKLWEVKDVTALEKIGRFVLQNIGQRFSYRKISGALEINLKTTQNYLDYLKNSFLVYFVEYYAKSSAMQIKKEKKVFTIDSILTTSYFEHENFGSLAENAVFVHLERKELKPNYWKNTWEVDFVVEEETPLPIEVKYRESINHEDFKGLYSFFKHYENSQEGLLVTKNEFKTHKTTDGRIIKLIPLWLFLLE